MGFRVSSQFYKPQNGRYIGEFIGTEDGPQQKQRNDKGEEVIRNTIKWQFHIYNMMDGSVVIDPNTGEAAIAEGLSGDSVGMGRGVPAKARGWLTKLLAANGKEFVDPTKPEDVDEMVRQALGAKVVLNFGRSPQAGKDGTLLEIEQFTPAPTTFNSAVATPSPFPAS